MDESLLRGLYDGCTQQDRQLTLQYFEHLQSTNDAWKLCMSYFTERTNSEDDRVLFFCLQILEHHVKTRHAISSDEDIYQLRKFILTWFDPSSDTQNLKSFIKNKMAQIVSLIFVIDYPLKWPQFFNDIFSLLDQNYNMSTLDMYLRTLLAIDSEIVDREIIHSQENNIRNTVIKDHIRDTCVLQLVESWLNILSSYESINHEVLCLTLSVIGCYVTWIDITFIANDKFIRFLLNFLSLPSIRESAADCLHDIINKGMEPLTKLELVESLVKLLEGTGILTSSNEIDDVDFQTKMSRLVNGMGVALIASYQKLLKVGDEINAKLVLSSIDTKVPYMLHYLTDEDDGISEYMIGFATQYVIVLKHLTNLSDDNRQNLQTLLYAVINKLKYDNCYNFNNPAEEEALFIEYRTKLHVLFDNIAQVDAVLVLSTVQSLVTQCIYNLEQESFSNVEVALLVFYYISEVSFEKMFGTAATVGSPFNDIMQLLMESRLSFHYHSAVLLQYYETILRQEKFFTTSPQYISQVMEGFLDHRGLRHTNPAVRSRLSYQFLRFIKSIRTNLANIAEEVLERIRDILFGILDLYNTSSLLTPNDTLFLYEAAGYLVVYSSGTPDKKQELMNSILTPLLEKFNHYLSELCSTFVPQQQDDISQLLYHILSYASRTSKVFPNHQLAQQCGCIPCFIEALPIVLQGLQVTVHREILQSGVRQYLHRMIICLGDELLKFIPMAVSLLLKDAESRDIQEFIPLINQLITKYKVRITPFLQEVFVPVVQTIITCSNRPFDPLDTEECRDRLNLQKSYFLFINSLCVNGVTEVIANQGNEHLQNVLETIVDGAKTSTDPSVKRICFMSLKKLVESWSSANDVDGFVDYSHKEILPLCFIVPLDQEFDLNEAQSYLCLGEIAGVIKALIHSGGNSFLFYLQNQYLPSLQIHPDVIQEMLVKLQEADTKSLKPYLKEIRKLNSFQ